MNTRSRMFPWVVVAAVVTQSAPHGVPLAGAKTHRGAPEDEWASLPTDGKRAAVSTEATNSALAALASEASAPNRSSQSAANALGSGTEAVESELPHAEFAMNSAATNIERAFTEPPIGDVPTDFAPERSGFAGGIGLATGYQSGPDVRGVGLHLSARVDYTERRSRFSAVFWAHFLMPPDELVDSFFPNYGYEHQLSLRYAWWRFSIGLESEVRTLSHDGIRPRTAAAAQLGFGPSFGFRIIDAERCFLDVHFAWMPAAIRVAGVAGIPADLSDPMRVSATLDFAWRFLFVQAYLGASRYGAVITEFFVQPIAGVFAGARRAW